ncbi:unnamed protein product [Ilex paraguariensis]|uniref:Triosephosphate isomerase n=1 Tax=Ilex paraguariensis TaxID=185542 RepID=A0ABC8SST9_9AQUA
MGSIFVNGALSALGLKPVGSLFLFAEMLLNLSIPWVIIGHSERRLLLGEPNEFVGDKVAYALDRGLKVITSVGETPEQRESRSTMAVVAAQTKAIAGEENSRSC